MSCHSLLLPRYINFLFNDPHGEENYILLNRKFLGNMYGVHYGWSEDIESYFQTHDMLRNLQNMLRVTSRPKGMSDVMWQGDLECKCHLGYYPCYSYSCRKAVFVRGLIAYEANNRVLIKDNLFVNGIIDQSDRSRCMQAAQRMTSHFVDYVRLRRAPSENEPIPIFQRRPIRTRSSRYLPWSPALVLSTSRNGVQRH